MNIDNVGRAIACFERTIVTSPAPFDFYDPITKFETAWFVDDSQQVWAWDRNPPDSDGVYTFIPASHNPASVMSPMFKECSDDLRKHVLDRMKQRNQRNRFWALSKDAGEAARTTHPKVDWLGSTLVLTSKVVPKT